MGKLVESNGVKYCYPDNWEESKRTSTDDIQSMLVDQEYRLTLLELGLTE